MVKNLSAQAITFPGMTAGEHFQFFYRQHWMRLAGMMQALAAGTALYAAALWLITDTQPDDTRRLLLAFASGAYLLLQLALLTRFYRHFLYVVVVTDAKVYRIKKTLLTVDDRQTIDLWSLSDATATQHGLFQNMLGFGTLVLHGTEETRIHFTPRVRQQLNRISHLRAQARNRAMGTSPRAPQSS
jgi:hypothetical protein